MAALLLSFAGASLGAALGPAGMIGGRMIGAIAGGLIDRALFGPSPRRVEGPRLKDLDVMGSTEGAPIPRVYGRVRISGQVIWATRLEEVVSTRSESAGGGKGGGPRVTTTTYSYFANFAVGLCEGPIARVGRVWADGKPLDLGDLDVRIYLGGEDQLPDPLIEAKQGAAAPAYRGLAYMVFDRLPLESFGNRIPQISVEILRPVGRLEQMLRAVTIIPGSTEFGYDTVQVVRALGQGAYAAENRHIASAATDWTAAIDELQACCPNLERAALVVAWFGNDLRADECLIRPGVDRADKQTTGSVWSVAGNTRGNAYVVSQHEGRPAFGGTPSDASVVRAIQDLNARGIKVTFYPFVMMDVPANNTLPDPWSDAAAQPAYPWRGRISCDPAPGRPETVDGTAAAAAQIGKFFGEAEPSDFSVSGTGVNYSGPGEWTLRRMVLHYAKLCTAAGGVDSFLIGSEFEALTRVRSAPGVYPAVEELISLAEDVRSIFQAAGQDTKISYAANWTELGTHVVDPEAQEVRFPLDPLWASNAVDFIGIDYYAPLSDWRDGSEHADADNAESIYDRDYLRANLSAGEAYDFYYADDSARRNQLRTPITDNDFGKPWMYRAKDLWNWWSQPHVERMDGTELVAPTAWVPGSKPIWLTEAGCPAVDKGSNQPNVFPDAKSSAGGFPFFSNRRRDDLIQRRFLEAVCCKFDPAYGANEADNPSATLYPGRMVDPSAVYAWTWDARPYPAFPLATDVWADGVNWETGHWLNGRLGATPLDDLTGKILNDYGIEGFDTSRLRGAADGYLIDRPMSARAAIEPLALALAFDAVEEGDAIVFRPRGGKPVALIGDDDLVIEDKKPECRLTRAQETELPASVSLGFTEIAGDFRRASVRSRRLVVRSRRESNADLALVANDAVIERAADIWLQDLWAGRERAEFLLPPSLLALMPGDVVTLDYRGRARHLEISETVDAESRAVGARTIDPDVFDVPFRMRRSGTVALPIASGPPEVIALDLPGLNEDAEPALQHLAVHVSPWPGAMAIWRSSGETFERIALANISAVIGQTIDPLPPGPAAVWDRANSFRVKLASGSLASAGDIAVLGGANAAAVKHADGAWEVIQFANAELVAPLTYRLSRLLRGQLGSEWTMTEILQAGADFVLLDRALVPVASGVDLLGRKFTYRVGRATEDVGSPNMTAFEASAGATALMPWAPVHLRGERIDTGVRITWIRRTRRGGDSWETAEVPLGEATESYLVEVLHEDSPVRALSTTSPELIYQNDSEIEDFGAPQSSLTVRVSQLSAVAGAGRPLQAQLQL